MFGFDDLVGSLFGGGGVSTPYSDANAPLFNQLQGQALGIGQFFNPQNLINSYNPNKQLEQSAGILSGFNPNSFFQGANGSFGQAGKLFGQASNYANADPFGAQDYFKNVLQPGFTDVTQDPQLQAALGALTNQSQQFLNQNADVVNASAQRAAGGTGAGTAGANQISNLVAQTGQNLSNQQAQLLLGEQARRQGIQQSRSATGFRIWIKTRRVLGKSCITIRGLGQAQGNLGAQQAGTSIDWAKALQGLGAYNQGNQQQQQLIPFQLQQALAQLLQGQVTNSPGLVGGLGQFIGNLQGVVGRPQRQ